MTAIRRRRGATVQITCSQPSHEDRPTLIAEFQEERDTAGTRVNVAVVHHMRRTAAGDEIVTHHRDDVEIGPVGITGRRVRNPKPSPVVESVIDAAGQKVADPTYDDDTAGRRWHYQLRCPVCGLNVSVRRERLVTVVGKLLDAGVSRMELDTLARIVG